MKNKLKLTFSFCTVLLLSSCASMQAEKINIAISEADMFPVKNPMPVKTFEIYDEEQKKRVNVDVLSLEGKDIRKRLTSYETFISVEKLDSNGAFNYVGAGGKVSKGTYKVTFDYVNYLNRNIDIDDNSTAVGRIGVGLRVTATLDTSSREVDVSGLLPIGIAAKNNKVSGQIKYYVYGMSNDKIAVSAPTSKNLDLSAIQEAFEAAAKTKVLFNLDETNLEPYLIGIARVDSIKAKEASEIVTKKITEGL